MAKKLDPRLIEILKEYDEDPNEALWDCHGTWVAYHRAIERIAAKAGIKFDLPVLVETVAAEKIAVIIVGGTMGERYEWSFGEATPANNKNAYPFAMAEKRAKDRVVLKLVGLNGIYSEEEADDFKAQRSVEDIVTNSIQNKPTHRIGVNSKTGERTASSIRKEEEAQLRRELSECQTVHMITKLAMAWSVKAETEKWPEAWKAWARGLMQDRKEAILNTPADDDNETSIKYDPDDARTGTRSTLEAG